MNTTGPLPGSDAHLPGFKPARQPGRWDWGWILVRRLIQWFIGLVLLATGIGKLLDVPGFIKVIYTYHVFPAIFHPVIAVTMIIIELRLAEWILRGHYLGRAALASLSLHSAFATWAALALIRGLQIENCGCFGIFFARPLTWTTVGEDVFMVVLSGALYGLSKRENRL